MISNNSNNRKVHDYVKPMLAKEISASFDDKDWLFEIKWDGYRAIAEKHGKDILMYSRNGLSFKNTYPVVVDQLKNIKQDAVLDGEVVVLNDEGKPDFQLLQHYSENQDRPIQYYIFDLLELNGKDTTSLPLVDRKELLQKIIPDNPVIKYSDHIVGKGKSFFKVSQEKDLEGIMGKKMNSLYYPGSRTTEWLKIKNHKTAEAIIAGYTPPAGSRKYFGSLILATKEGNQLEYVGNAGTGFNHQSLKELFEKMQPLFQEKSPFEEKIKNNSSVTWIKPALICEIKYSEVTSDGKFRHPVFLHLRNDKTLDEINMENINKTKVASKKGTSKKGKDSSKSAKSSAEKSSKDNDKIYTFGKDKVKVTSIDKVYFPDEGITKGDIVEYYISMSKYILPYLKGRPESLLRHPNGITEQSFFQKDAADN
ncbi:MAG: non-homologous end-joining DNA ligase, partial [Ginsengibacter sp.]